MAAEHSEIAFLEYEDIVDMDDSQFHHDMEWEKYIGVDKQSIIKLKENIKC